MSDLLGDALARWDDNHPARPMTTFYYSQVVAAARSWHTLTNPTDELIERVATVLADHDTVLVEDAPEIYLPLARKVVDALTVTADD